MRRTLETETVQQEKKKKKEIEYQRVVCECFGTLGTSNE